MLVDKSGCLKMRPAGMPMSARQHTMVRNVFNFSLCFIINCAKNKINIILAVSDGWNRKLPNSSHLWAPPASHKPVKLQYPVVIYQGNDRHDDHT